MPRYWVIAPYHANEPEAFDRVLKFDLDNGLISIGWRNMGDVSSSTYEQMVALSIDKFESTNSEAASDAGQLWKFYNDVKIGDVVVARRGRKVIAAVGTVKGVAFYEPSRNQATVEEENAYPNHLEVEWLQSPRDKKFAPIVFAMQTIYEIGEEKYLQLTETTGPSIVPPAPVEEDVQDEAAFVLEKYLEDFVVSNFSTIFKSKLALHADLEGNVVGQQFPTDVGPIDILAFDSDANAFVVIELKKGRPADKVIGQTLRYMGWVAEHLCKAGQGVRGVIICKESDDKLNFALKMVSNVSVKYYKVDFKLEDLS